MNRALFVLAACPLWVTCSRPSSRGGGANGYWSQSCLSGDGRYLLAGGDHAGLVDLSTGKIVERVTGMVKAVGCDETGGVVVGYLTAVRLPGKAATPVPSLSGDRVLARAPGGAWISEGRRISSGRWRGPASLFVLEKGESRPMDLLPERFGTVGAARPLPTPDSFAVRFGNLLRDRRLLLAAGWQPSRSGRVVEDIPWGFFALDLGNGEAAPLTPPLDSTAAMNQNLLQKIAASPDAAHLVVAVHDGEQMSVARFEQGARRPSQVTSFAAQGSPSAAAISADGAFVAVGSETRGRDAPGRVWVIDRTGKTVWTTGFQKTVAGVHFLSDGSLVVVAGEVKAVKLALPAATEAWRAE